MNELIADMPHKTQALSIVSALQCKKNDTKL
jgi:hypothetical protein